MMGGNQVIVAGRVPDDGNGALVLAAGLVAALAGGFGWAAIVIFTNYEIGWAAWGVGLLVGLAMVRVTDVRSPQLGVTAGVLAAIGLILGKVFILVGSVGTVADELLENQEWMHGAYAWQLYEEERLGEETMAGIDATFASGDTLSDALWGQMLTEASGALEGLAPDQLETAAQAAAHTAIFAGGWLQGLMTQFTAFDLLWFFLAIGTAWGMMARHTAHAAAAPARSEPEFQDIESEQK